MSRSLLLRCAVAGVAVAVCGAAIPAAAQDHSGSSNIDVLQASRDQIRSEVAALEGRIAERTKAVTAAEAALNRATAAVTAAESQVATTRREVAKARGYVRDYAVEAFVRPPAGDSLAILSIRQMEAAANASNVLHILASRRKKVVDTLVARQKRLESQQQQAREAKAHAKER
ncbi:MAG: hypothetical protein ACKOYM_02685, partial [Actinomycetes bacterium]